jgi:hypothetical protein
MQRLDALGLGLAECAAAVECRKVAELASS